MNGCHGSGRFYFFIAALLASMVSNLAAQETALDKYVAKPDSSYHWKIVERFKQPGLTTLVIDMKSQTWRSPEEVNRTLWQHWLVVAMPDKVSSETGLLFISGGRNGGDPPSGPDERNCDNWQSRRSLWWRP